LRHLIVAPFGLKSSGKGSSAPGGIIGLFPVLSQTSERLVAGFDDCHLNFRVLVDVAPAEVDQEVTSMTLAWTHNWLGRPSHLDPAVSPCHCALFAPSARRATPAECPHDNIRLSPSIYSPYACLVRRNGD